MLPQTGDKTGLADQLKEALLDTYDIEAVILFGSIGRGDWDEFSDVDLLLVMETDRETASLSQEMTGYLEYLTKDIHILVRTPWDYFRQQDIPGTMVYAAVKEGRVLFDKRQWREEKGPLESYETRKREVITLEYIQMAHDYLDRAGRSLQKGSLFRSRDFTRFAIARVIKGVFVKHDLHPPRETDLVNLIMGAGELEDEVKKYMEPVAELNRYSPGRADSTAVEKMAGLLEKAVRFVDRMEQVLVS